MLPLDSKPGNLSSTKSGTKRKSDTFHTDPKEQDFMIIAFPHMFDVSTKKSNWVWRNYFHFNLEYVYDLRDHSLLIICFHYFPNDSFLTITLSLWSGGGKGTDYVFVDNASKWM